MHAQNCYKLTKFRFQLVGCRRLTSDADSTRMLVLIHILLAPTLALPTVVPSLSAIADRYDAILLDQFGVLHDGAAALPGAIECFSELSKQGKKLIVLSNTSRRRAFAITKLPKLGFDESKLTGFVTSGEAAWEHMAKNCRGQRALYISWSDEFMAWDPSYLDGCEITLAGAADADFVLLHGSHVLRDGGDEPPPTGIFQHNEPSEALTVALQTCAKRGLQMICVCAYPGSKLRPPMRPPPIRTPCLLQPAASKTDC